MANNKEAAEAGKITNTQMDQEAKKWGEILAKQPKRRIKIKPKNDKDKEPVPVGINGYFYYINKGETVEVPESVALILEEADYI